jgi:hypothetical protein
MRRWNANVPVMNSPYLCVGKRALAGYSKLGRKGKLGPAPGPVLYPFRSVVAPIRTRDAGNTAAGPVSPERLPPSPECAFASGILEPLHIHVELVIRQPPPRSAVVRESIPTFGVDRGLNLHHQLCGPHSRLGGAARRVKVSSRRGSFYPQVFWLIT